MPVDKTVYFNYIYIIHNNENFYWKQLVFRIMRLYFENYYTLRMQFRFACIYYKKL